MVATFIILLISIIILGILVSIIGTYLEAKAEARRNQEQLALLARAAENKQQLDAQAFRAAQAIQAAIGRNGGTRG